MELYYVEIRSTLNGVLLHAELVMTHSKENADAVAREHFLNDVTLDNRNMIKQNLMPIDVVVELVTDVETLGENKTPYYTNEILTK